MTRRRIRTVRRLAATLLAATCLPLALLTASCGKGGNSAAPQGGTPGPGPGPGPGSGSAEGDSANWAVANEASALYFSLKGSPNRNASTVTYLLSKPNVEFAGVSDSLGNVWACFDNGRVLLYVVNCLAGIFIFGLIALYCWPTIIEAFVERAFEGEHPVRIPVWPIKLIVFIGAVLMTIEYIVQLVAAIRRKITPDSIDEVAPVVDLVEQFADDPEPPRPAASAQSDRKDS